MRQLALNFQLNKNHVVLFIILNLLDLGLTLASISLGSTELNPILRLGSLPLLKAILSLSILLLLLRFSKGHLLKLLNIGLVVIVIYNIFALLSWLK